MIGGRGEELGAGLSSKHFVPNKACNTSEIGSHSNSLTHARLLMDKCGRVECTEWQDLEGQRMTW